MVISYELAMGMAVVGVIMLTGSLSLGDIVHHQDFWPLGWNVFRQPLGKCLPDAVRRAGDDRNFVLVASGHKASPRFSNRAARSAAASQKIGRGKPGYFKATCVSRVSLPP